METKMARSARRQSEKLGRSERVSLRTTDDERALLEKAALLATSGDLTRFIVSASVAAARQVVDDYETSRVSADMRRAFYELLLKPPAPSQALLDLAAEPDPDGFTFVK
jgi:uncharacterized protein (DUF1778 family)